jgi:hypothetical protein
VTRRALLALFLIAAAAMFVWRHELFTVQKPGARPLPLALVPAPNRRTVAFDATLAAVPAGAERLHPGGGVLLVHYWAPWERHSGQQARGLDSLRRILPPGSVRVAVVCFDPYPSVARYVARLRLRLPVLLDQRRQLAGQLACPSIPYTYVLDRSGRIAVEQAGEVDWLAPATRASLDSLFVEPEPAAAPTRVPLTAS